MPRFSQKRGRSQSRTRQTKRSKKNPYTRKRPAYKRRAATSTRRFNKSVLNVIKKTAEPKFIHTAMTDMTSMNHNSINFQNINSRDADNGMFPHQGDEVGQRDGNEVYAKGFMLRGSFCLAGDRRGTTLRFYLISEKDNNHRATYDNVFQNITNNVALDPLDKTKFPSTKLIATLKIPDRSAPTTSVDGTFELIDSNVIFKKWIPFNKKQRS
ncbi:hypothetical protein T484DRAFT_1755759 [Baffinella frigidus]|nr:hypothetical protein T484DRAFT_1755759 [Cryptophyta sp. CCMP2293]